MDELGFTLAGFAVLGVLHYAVAIVSGSGTYRPPQNAGLRRRPAYHPAETRAGVVRAAFNECRY